MKRHWSVNLVTKCDLNIGFAGKAVVQALYMITGEKNKKVPVAGSRCIEGSLQRKSLYKLVRDGEILYDGTHLLFFWRLDAKRADGYLVSACFLVSGIYPNKILTHLILNFGPKSCL